MERIYFLTNTLKKQNDELKIDLQKKKEQNGLK